MSQATSQAFHDIQGDLARVIRKRRSDCTPHETARQLLVHDQPGHTALVGISNDGERAVLYHERDSYAISVRFGPDGLADGGAKLASFQDGSTLEAWIERMEYYWGWIHSRFR